MYLSVRILLHSNTQIAHFWQTGVGPTSDKCWPNVGISDSHHIDSAGGIGVDVGPTLTHHCLGQRHVIRWAFNVRPIEVQRLDQRWAITNFCHRCMGQRCLHRLNDVASTTACNVGPPCLCYLAGYNCR